MIQELSAFVELLACLIFHNRNMTYDTCSLMFLPSGDSYYQAEHTTATFYLKFLGDFFRAQQFYLDPGPLFLAEST